MKLLVILLLAVSLGCAFNLGRTTEATGSEPATTIGISLAVGQSSAGPVEGGAISLPGAAVVGSLVCAASSAALVMMGRAPLDCGAAGVEGET